MLQPMFHNQTYTWDKAVLSLGRRTVVMGILNVTPDSFSDGGCYNRIDRALQHAKHMAACGVDIIDVGGESTRPGAERVEGAEELRRVIPVIEALHSELPQVLLSIDTYKADVGKRALQAGAHILNDIWGCKKDPAMAHVAAAYQCPLILMHNRLRINEAPIVNDVKRSLIESIALAKQAGVKDDHIWLDPGIGFAKEYDHNLTLLRHVDELVNIGYPVVLATSRKRVIRDTLQQSAQEVTYGTAATIALGIAQGCQIVRVHDVEEMIQTVRMCDAILYEQKQVGK